MKTDLFQSCGHCWVLQICWHTECSTFTAWSFRIWNSSTGIPSPPLALFVVMLPKAHLTSHSRSLALGECEWSHLCDYLGCEDLFFIVLLCSLATSWYLLLLWGPYHFCPLLIRSGYLDNIPILKSPVPYNNIIMDMISYHIQRLRDYGRTPLWSLLPSNSTTRK